jgi:dolichol-phosphate mannosyltransferase
LINRKVINHVKNFKEKNIFLRGVLFYVGFNQIGLEYDRKERLAGYSKFSLMQYFDFGQNGILAFTKFPLKFIAVFGCTVLMINIILILYYLYLYFAGGITQPGFTTLVLVFLLSFSMIIFFLGIISLYVGQIIDEVKNRPRYIIDEKSKF